MSQAIVIGEHDNVATALVDLSQGTPTTLKFGASTRRGPVVVDSIPFGHKFAILPITKGENIFKYGEVIGQATKDISVGEHVHVHNVASLRGRGDLGPKA